MPRSTILVAPAPLHSIDGRGPSPRLRVLGHAGNRRITHPVRTGDPARTIRSVAGLIDSDTRAIWVGNRHRLATRYAKTDELERGLRGLADAHRIPLCGFTGRSASVQPSTSAYDEVRDGSSVSTRRPNSRT